MDIAYPELPREALDYWMVHVRGAPVPWRPARTVTLPGGKMMHYTPKHVRVWQKHVRDVASVYWPDRVPPWEGPVLAKMRFEIELPNSWPAWKCRVYAGRLCVQGGRGPDAGNLEKAVLDALEGVAYVNDLQVPCPMPRKVWTSGDPGVTIQLYLLPALPRTRVEAREQGFDV